MSDLLAGFYGDDFTGSVDALLQFSRAGLRGRLFVGRPDAETLRTAVEDTEVIGLAGIARSLADPALTAEVRSALELLGGLGPTFLQYKACSTADSSPTVGNLGRVIEIGRDLFGERTVPMLFAQPDFGRYTAFGHHFAADGGIVHRLDRQPTMAHHPTTPMDESDLCRHLARQTSLPIGSLGLNEYRDPATITQLLANSSDAAAVLDAVDDHQVALVGAGVAGLAGDRPTFAVGSGGLSTGLGRALAGHRAIGTQPSYTGLTATGPVLAVSGSRSPQTERQVQQAVRHGWHRIDLAPNAELSAEAVLPQVLQHLAAGRSVVVTTGATITEVGPDLLDRLSEQLATLVRSALTSAATGRIIVCGGDTSSRLLTLLGAESLRIAANPFGNVVICRVSAGSDGLDGTEMLLKGGQVGDVDLFETVRQLTSTT